MYWKSLEEVLKELGSSLEGLDEEEAKRRLQQYGPNEIESKKSPSFWDAVISQFENFVLWLLVLAAGLSFYLGKMAEGFVITLAVMLSVLFGAYLEYKADKALEAISQMVKEKTLVIRKGKRYTVDSRELVPGDIVELFPGQKVPADIYLIEANNLQVDESVLTGESIPIDKKPGPVPLDTPLYERKNMLYAGTFVVNGWGKGVVVATGKQTEMGKIAQKLELIEREQSQLKKDLEEFGKLLSAIVLVLAFFLFLIGYTQGYAWDDLILTTLTLIVAGVPEGFLTIFVLIFAFAVMELAKKAVLVRKMASLEGLASMDTLVTDKTGTITEGKLHLEHILGDRDKVLEKALLASNVQPTQEGYEGDDLEVAIAKKAEELWGRERVVKILKRKRKVIPFSPEKKYAEARIGKKIIRKGAPDYLLEDDSFLDKWYQQGYRIIVVVENGKYIGALLFRDPPKKDVKEAIRELYSLNIDIFLLTGDNKKTAKAIAEEVGIKGKAEDFAKATTPDVRIFARATPMDKYSLVTRLKQEGRIVGTIGDGVNDALALKNSHVAITMGKRGAELTKQIADVVIMNDKFSCLVEAIEKGRNTIEKLSKFVKFQISTNISLLLHSFMAFLLQIPHFTPIQILFVNILMDGPPGLALAFEKDERIKRQRYSFFDKRDLSLTLATAISMSGITLYLSSISPSLAFNTFVMMQISN
ncbi:MAG: cation-transporting P-type ATPase, partial [Candidatus Micrarchaeota archaeon]|nr:cation-transporting P-type ATPase [Candidatus Micrarchaeota archaeon]